MREPRGYITEGDIAEGVELARAGIRLGCPWCRGAEPFGHECATRDHYLDIEDSELQ